MVIPLKNEIFSKKKECLDCGESKSKKGLYCKKCGYKHRTRRKGLIYIKHKENPTSFKKGEHHSPYEFKQGHLTWNKGLKGTHFSLSTEFKKGHIGEGIPKFNINGNLGGTYQARKAIERFYGIKWSRLYLPQKTIIHHIDGDIHNNSFENLCVMSRSDHCRFHRGVNE